MHFFKHKILKNNILKIKTEIKKGNKIVVKEKR